MVIEFKHLGGSGKLFLPMLVLTGRRIMPDLIPIFLVKQTLAGVNVFRLSQEAYLVEVGLKLAKSLSNHDFNNTVCFGDTVNTKHLSACFSFEGNVRPMNELLVGGFLFI